MSKFRYIGKHKTSVDVAPDLSVTEVKYHDTVIVRFNYCAITLDNGGFFTVTTKRRMNQVSQEYNLGFSVYQKNFNWYVDYKGETIPFDGSKLTLERGVYDE